MNILDNRCLFLILLSFFLTRSTLNAQSPYDAFEKAEQLFEEKNSEEAYGILSNTMENIKDYKSPMSYEEAEKFYDLFVSVSYSMGKKGIIDSIYLSGIEYGKLIQNDSLTCKYINLRGNLLRIKNKWQEAVDETGKNGHALTQLAGMGNLNRVRVEDVMVPRVEITSVPLDILNCDGFNPYIATMPADGYSLSFGMSYS